MQISNSVLSSIITLCYYCQDALEVTNYLAVVLTYLLLTIKRRFKVMLSNKISIMKRDSDFS